MEVTKIEKYKIKNRETLNQKVYNIVKLMIIDGEFKQGEKLNETDLAERIGVSATPVRETFRTLASEGLVEIVPYKGVFVREYTLKEIKEVYECRKALENLAIELAIDKLDEEKLIAISEKTKKLQGNGYSSYEISNELHSIIHEAADNDLLLKMLNQINHILLHDRNISAHDDKRRSEICSEHLELIDRLLDRDLKGAKEVMTNHVINGYKYICKVKSQE